MKKFSFLIAVSFLLINSCKAPDGKISGVVTYYLNKNNKDVPDVGASIHIVNQNNYDSLKAKILRNFDCDLINSEINGLRIVSRMLAREKNNSLDSTHPTESQLTLERALEKERSAFYKKINIHSEKEFNDYISKVSKEILLFQLHNKKFLANGSGAFSTDLPPGKYYILLQSNHTIGMTSVEVPGQIAFRSIEIKSGEEIPTNVKFDATKGEKLSEALGD